MPAHMAPSSETYEWACHQPSATAQPGLVWRTASDQIADLLAVLHEDVLAEQPQKPHHQQQQHSATARRNSAFPRPPPRKSCSFNTTPSPASAHQLAHNRMSSMKMMMMQQQQHVNSAGDAVCSVRRLQQQQHQAHTSKAAHPAGAAARQQHDMQALLNMLMSKVITLTAEKQQLAATCSGLKQENAQLTDLVLVMSDTMKQQQQHAKVLLRLASSQAGSQSGSPKAAAAAATATTSPLPARARSDSATGTATAAARPAKPPQRTASLPLELPETDDVEAVVSCTLPSPGSEQQASEPAPAFIDHARMHSRQQRVAEWLQTKPRDWREWQSCLPLETTVSSSSSSLQLALDDALAHPDPPAAPAAGAS